MRFHTAATFLAQSLLPLVDWSDALAVEKKRKKARHLLAQQILSQQQKKEEGLYYGVEGETEKKGPLMKALKSKRLGFANAAAHVESSKPEIPDEPKECKLTSEGQEGLDSVFGFLSGCGPNEECVESELSKTGGVCLKETAAMDATKARRRMQNGQYCSLDDGYDGITYTGTYRCDYPEECSDVVPSICGTFASEYVQVNGTTVDANVCWNFTSGVSYQTVCYGYREESLPSCFIEVDGTSCNTCVFQKPCPGLDMDGAIFDCTNTALGTAGDECMGVSIFQYENELLPTSAGSSMNTGVISAAVSFLAVGAAALGVMS